MVDFLIITAMVTEFSAVTKHLRARVIPDRYRSMVARVGRQTLGIVQVGIGPRRAQRGTTWAIDAYQPKRALVLGIAGGLDPNISPGQIIHAERLVSQEGASLDLPATELEPIIQGASDGELLRGTIVESDRVVACAADKEQLHRMSTAHAVDMESYSAAKVCHVKGVPIEVVRFVTDSASESLPAEIDRLMSEEGNPRFVQALRCIARRPSLFRELWAMERAHRPVIHDMRGWSKQLLTRYFEAFTPPTTSRSAP